MENRVENYINFLTSILIFHCKVIPAMFDLSANKLFSPIISVVTKHDPDVSSMEASFVNI